MIDHQTNKLLRDQYPDVADFQRRILAAVTDKVTSAFRNNDIIRRDILTEVTTIINNMPLKLHD